MDKEHRNNFSMKKNWANREVRGRSRIKNGLIKKALTIKIAIILVFAIFTQSKAMNEPIVEIKGAHTKEIYETTQANTTDTNTADTNTTDTNTTDTNTTGTDTADTNTTGTDTNTTDAIVEKNREKLGDLVDGIEAYENKKYETALRLLDIAEGEYLKIGKEERKAVRRIIELYRLKALYRLGLFKEALKLSGRIDRLDEEGKRIVEESVRFVNINLSSDEDSLNAALIECPESHCLLKKRIRIRLYKKKYKLAQLDINKLKEIELQEKEADTLMTQCYFLMGEYNKGLAMLKEIEGCKELSERAKGIIDKYEAINRYYYRPTETNYGVVRQFIDKDMILAKMSDSVFTPNIFSFFLVKSLENAVRIGMAVDRTDKVIEYSERLLKEKSVKGEKNEKEWREHIEVLIRKKKFTDAVDLIKKNMVEGSTEYERVRRLYNEKIKEARERKNREDERKRKEKAKKEKEEKKAALEKERAQSKRRMQYVKSRRGREIDSEGFYKFLEVKPGSPKEALMKAYRKISRTANINSRRNQNNKELFEKYRQMIIKANKAREVFINDILKEEYDSGYYMTEKEKAMWGYSDEMMERHGGGYEHGDHFGGHNDIFEILMNSGGFGGGFGGGFTGGRRVVYYR